MKLSDKKNAVTPLNEELNTEFKIQQLEERLETDPLSISGLWSISNPENYATCFEISCDSGFKIEF